MYCAGPTSTGGGASQGELSRLGEASGLPAMVGATSVKMQHFASTRSDPCCSCAAAILLSVRVNAGKKQLLLFLF